jgi:hypothetical protein
MGDEAVALARRTIYLDQMRVQGRAARYGGMVACLIGVMILIVARFKLGAPLWMLWTGGLIVAAGWGLFVYSLLRRLAWVRTHPFDPNG